MGMRRRSIGLLAAAMLAAIAASGSPAADPPPGLEVEVTVAEEAADTFLATAVIRDLASGEVLCAPSVRLGAGQEGTIRSTGPEGDEVLFTVRVREDGREASYRAQLVRGGETVAGQRATLRLGP